MVRPALMKGDLEALETHPYLAVEDFETKEVQGKNNEGLNIIYRYRSDLFFKFEIPSYQSERTETVRHDIIGLGNTERTVQEYVFHCEMSPGHESSNEAKAVAERSKLLQEITKWMARLYEDTVSAPVVRQFDSITAKLEEVRTRLQQVPDEPLSRSEIDDLRKSLEQVKNDLVAQLQKEVEDKEQLKQRVEVLSRDIDFLKQTLESTTKRKWIEMFLSRIHRWRGKLSLKQITTGANAVSKLLPPELGQTVETVATTMDTIADAFKEPPKADSQS